MNCANHADVSATAYCRTCGKPLCSTCTRDVRGVIYCEECLASQLSGTMPPPGPAAVPPGAKRSGAPSPGLAAILGVIPGVGAMYNGEFAKGFIHVVIFATLIWMTDNVNGLFGIAIAAFVIYMPVEAYKTARAKEMGLPAPDPFGLNNLFSSGGSAKPAAAASATPAGTGANPAVAGAAPPEGASAAVAQAQPLDAACGPTRVPVGAFILIGLGVLFLLDELGVMHMHNLWRFWPLVLIAIGIRILMRRTGRSW